MRFITLLFLSYLCVACQSASNEPVTAEGNQQGKDSAIELLADDYLAAYLLRYPETGSFLSLANTPHDKLMANGRSYIPIHLAETTFQKKNTNSSNSCL
jgi:hypothetical protein